MASINRISPQGLKAILSVLSTPTAADFEDGTLKAMILCSDNDLSTDSVWNATAALDSVSFTLDEYYTGSDTTRRHAVSVSSLTVSSAQVQVGFSNLVWTSLVQAASTREPTHVLIYMQKSGVTVPDGTGELDDRVPVAIFDAAFTTDGTTFTALMPVGTLYFDT